ncbi:MAG TPA: TadE/TadG family type IV pilus assembly protein [Vicinamibacterales bacterium]|nr:TadE/TadG family type IV pilus assembly protein [Vicinamibacterales bacterium]
MRHRLKLKSERGAALLETALTLPLLLMVAVSIFEFGRAYQTWQVLTNAAREGARVAVLPNAPTSASKARVEAYLQSGQLAEWEKASTTQTTVSIDIGGGATAPASQVTVSYPFAFIVLQPVAQLLVKGSTVGGPLSMTASAVMRNE